ncbi:MAG: TrmH family RNA methyltransferase [Eubacteriaceae bacterium]
MKYLTSYENDSIKHILKLKNKKYRDLYGEYLIEGFKLVDEAIKAKEDIISIYISSAVYDEKKNNYYLDSSLRNNIIIVEENLFNKLVSTINTQGIIACIKKKNELRFNDINSNVLLLDRLQDPGNLGTIIRTADASGFMKIIASKGTVDIYNDKTVRSAMGSIFHLDIIKEADLTTEIQELKKKGFIILGSQICAKKIYTDLDSKNKYALIIGNESKGVSMELLQLCDERIKIPIFGKAESLNASVAAGIMMYHISSINNKLS